MYNKKRKKAMIKIKLGKIHKKLNYIKLSLKFIFFFSSKKLLYKKIT